MKPSAAHIDELAMSLVIIRNDATLDRPQARITTEQVHNLAKSIDGAFTTGDLASKLIESGSCRGMSFARVERAVRGAMSWLVNRELAYIDGETLKITGAGVISRPYIYRLYCGRTWDRKQREAKRSEGDFTLLYRAFC